MISLHNHSQLNYRRALHTADRRSVAVSCVTWLAIDNKHRKLKMSQLSSAKVRFYV